MPPAASPLAGLLAGVPGERAGVEAKWGQAGARRGELCRHGPYGFWSFSTGVLGGGGEGALYLDFFGRVLV